jgi:hypothetical protein
MDETKGDPHLAQTNRISRWQQEKESIRSEASLQWSGVDFSERTMDT